MKVSIIIVHYKADLEFFDCLKSIYKNIPEFDFEVIIVDNDNKKIIEEKLAQKFPKTRYIKSETNVGFGAGNNLGAKHARGEYLFFLNPDTIIFTSTLDNLINFIETNINAGIVAPLLLHEDKKPFDLQGSADLTPLRGVVCLSIINKIFPKNPIAQKFFYLDWGKDSQKEVEVVPGTAFAIRKELFEKVGMFDEKFFLYFEEYDICRRVRRLGFKLFIIPQAKIIHLWEKSTKSVDGIDKIFLESRFYYFKKHFGFLPAVIVELFCRISKKVIVYLFFIILITSFILSAYMSAPF
ncbi:MAG TPA: glycosyltransferase family 2 protein [Candidatus Saccharimonadales bacterium]|nr:glycosyltransferase family 2 protein [Candidatus Saccharimonadales bacterium]